MRLIEVSVAPTSRYLFNSICHVRNSFKMTYKNAFLFTNLFALIHSVVVVNVDAIENVVDGYEAKSF